MKLSDFECVEVNLKLEGWEIKDFIKREIGEDTGDWSCKDMELFIYEYIKDLIKGDFGRFIMTTRAVVNKPELGLKKLNVGFNPVYPERPYPNNIHAIKESLGLSNEKLGALCGLGYTTIANMDRGDRPVTDEYKELIEKATGYEVVRYYES